MQRETINYTKLAKVTTRRSDRYYMKNVKFESQIAVKTVKKGLVPLYIRLDRPMSALKLDALIRAGFMPIIVSI